MIEGLPVLDAHIHLDPEGRPSEAVERFKKAGGTHLLIVNKPYHHIREKGPGDFSRSFETTVRMCGLANEKGVRSWCVVGPYPVVLARQAEEMGVEKALELHLEALELAFDLVDEGRALGIGEIGRVHFPVDDEVQDACDEVLRAAARGARSRGCPIILHTESPSQNHDLFRNLTSIADGEGLDRRSMIKHYSGWEAAVPGIGMGLSVSMQARRKNIENALSRGLDFLLETDYIDDRERPNVVMPPDTVPKKVAWAYRKGLLDSDLHHHLMVELPEIVLGTSMEQGTRR